MMGYSGLTQEVKKIQNMNENNNKFLWQGELSRLLMHNLHMIMIFPNQPLSLHA